MSVIQESIGIADTTLKGALAVPRSDRCRQCGFYQRLERSRDDVLRRRREPSIGSGQARGMVGWDKLIIGHRALSLIATKERAGSRTRAAMTPEDAGQLPTQRDGIRPLRGD